MRPFGFILHISCHSLAAAVASCLAAVALLAQPGCSHPVESPAEHHSSGSHHDHEHDHGQHDEHDSHHEHDQQHEQAAAEDAGHDIQMPANISAAIQSIRDCRTQIVAAMNRNAPHDAHEPLDEMDVIIGRLMPLARADGIPKRDWEAANIARRELRAQFDRLHAAIDADESIDFAPIAQETETLLARLEAIVAQSKPDEQASVDEKSASPEERP